MQILLIEDDPRLAAFVAGSLRQEGHLVEHCGDGRTGLLRAAADRYDLIVLDRMLPQVDGLKILQTIRATGDATPVLILSALILGGGLYPQPGVLSRYVIATQLVEQRSRHLGGEWAASAAVRLPGTARRAGISGLPNPAVGWTGRTK